MNNTKEIILKLKEVREQKHLSLNDVVTLVENNGDYISRSTVQRVFQDGSEENNFKYDDTLRPIANALLDIDRIESEDDLGTQALKVLLQYKNQRIQELEAQLDKEKLRAIDKLDAERERSYRSIEFLKDQVSKKDSRIDMLLKHIMECPYRNCEVNK
jgi:transcriptional regulator with XRE-family HTH domain